MGMLERLFRGFTGGHHGRYGGGHHGRRGSFDYGPAVDYPREPQMPVSPGQRCDKCGAANLAQARYCQGCGTPLSKATCAGCGGEMSSGSRFCNQCGRSQ